MLAIGELVQSYLSGFDEAMYCNNHHHGSFMAATLDFTRAYGKVLYMIRIESTICP